MEPPSGWCTAGGGGDDPLLHAAAGTTMLASGDDLPVAERRLQPPHLPQLQHDAANNNKEQRNRNFQLQQDVQAIVSEAGKQKIQHLLDQVYGLLPIEQLLLYLKLPTEHSSAVDPLRQSMNPLGSRSEINQTIIWIQTHLEEDRELSLQKKGVYDDYVAFCEPNGIKPLSTADFGKVMKQVYPNVRPRRLGTRGQSKYCYSGLRSRVKLDAPLLPDLSEKTMSTESNCTQSDYMTAAWYIVKEWAEEKLSMQFQNVIALAYYLVKESSIAFGTEAAQMLTALATSSTAAHNDNTHYGYLNRHKETTMQLQRKIHQSKESKRKQMQSDKSEQKYRPKRYKGSPTSTSCSTSPVAPPSKANSPQDYAATANCDSANHSLPDFNSFQREPPAAEVDHQPPQTQPQPQSQPSAEQLAATNYSIGKAPITRIAVKQATSKRSKAAAGKYKLKAADIGDDTVRYDSPRDLNEARVSKTKRIKKEEALSFFPNEVSDPYFSRERLESVSQVSKDALDEYLGANSQEQEEEIIKYLGNGSGNDEDKLTQIRELLVQNCPPAGGGSAPGYAGTATSKTGARQTARVHGGGFQSAAQVKRRVSFDTSVPLDDGANFIPISSPTGGGGGGKRSMNSSTNASPFVSPRNTPIIRTSKRGPKPKRPNLELKLAPQVAYPPLYHLPMSAPPSPKTTYTYSKFYPNVQTNFALEEALLPPDGSDALGAYPLSRSQSVPVNAEQNTIYGNFPFAPAATVDTGLVSELDIMEMDSLPGDLQMLPADDGGMKFPSRSVPNTPLPYHQPSSLEFAAGSYEKANVSSKSYPTTPLASETFTYGQSHDYLINGQPIKEKPELDYMHAAADDESGGGASESMFAGFTTDGDELIDANKNVRLGESNIDDIFKVVPD